MRKPLCALVFLASLAACSSSEHLETAERAVVEFRELRQFEKGAGVEQFVFRVSDGKARLVSYNVNSPALLLN